MYMDRGRKEAEERWSSKEEHLKRDEEKNPREKQDILGKCSRYTQTVSSYFERLIEAVQQ